MTDGVHLNKAGNIFCSTDVYCAQQGFYQIIYEVNPYWQSVCKLSSVIYCMFVA